MTERKYAYFLSLRVFQHAAARDVTPLPMSCEIIPKTGQLGRVADVAAADLCQALAEGDEVDVSVQEDVRASGRVLQPRCPAAADRD